MNVGQAITAAMREQRKKDWADAMWGGAWGYEHINRLKTYVWWGWSITGTGGLGQPGCDV